MAIIIVIIAIVVVLFVMLVVNVVAVIVILVVFVVIHLTPPPGRRDRVFGTQRISHAPFARTNVLAGDNCALVSEQTRKRATIPRL